MTATNRTVRQAPRSRRQTLRWPSRINLVIVGATGMVGGYALRYALDHSAVGRATTIGRRKVGISHPKLKEVLHQDFADCSTLAEVRSDQDAAIFCLSAGAVSDTEHRTITVGVGLLERQWRGPDGTKSDVLRTLQGRRRERTAREGFCRRLHLPTGVHLPGDAAARVKFRLPLRVLGTLESNT